MIAGLSDWAKVLEIKGEGGLVAVRDCFRAP